MLQNSQFRLSSRAPRQQAEHKQLTLLTVSRYLMVAVEQTTKAATSTDSSQKLQVMNVGLLCQGPCFYCTQQDILYPCCMLRWSMIEHRINARWMILQLVMHARCFAENCGCTKKKSIWKRSITWYMNIVWSFNETPFRGCKILADDQWAHQTLTYFSPCGWWM